LVEDLTERRSIERQLRERDELLEAFFTQSVDGFYIALCDEPVHWGPDVDQEAVLDHLLQHTRITRVNPAMAAFYGMSEADMLGRTVPDFYHHAPDVPRRDLRAMLERGHVRLETEERKADGSTLWFSGDYIVLYDAEGRVRGHFGIQKDITEQKRWEEQLRQSRERVQTIFDALHDAVFLHDAETGGIRGVNERATELYGYSKDEFLRLRVADLSAGVPPYDQAEALAWMQRAQREGPQLFEWQAKDRSGRLFWVEVGMRAITLEGTPHILVTVRDISERKAMEAQLQERERLFRNLFERSPDPNFLLEGHRFIDCNPAAVTFLRAKHRDQLLRSHPWELSPDHQPDGRASQEKAADMIARAHRKGTHRFEWVHRRLDGTDVTVEVLLTAIPWQGKWILHTSLRDLTERIQAEAARKALEAQVLQSQKLESLGCWPVASRTISTTC